MPVVRASDQQGGGATGLIAAAATSMLPQSAANGGTAAGKEGRREGGKGVRGRRGGERVLTLAIRGCKSHTTTL